MSDNTHTFETYLLRTLPRTTSRDPFKYPPMSAATVSSLIAKATIEVSPLDDGLLNTINYDTGKQSSIAIFDDKGDIVSKAEYDSFKMSDRRRDSVHGCQVTGQSGHIQGLHMYNDIVAAICTLGDGCALYHNCKTIFKSSLGPLDRYFISWATVNRGTIRVDNRAFFVTADGKAASLLMDKAAVDRGDQIETVHHEQEGMVDVWADPKDLVCLSMTGDLEIVKYRLKHSRVNKSSQFKEAAFPMDRQFEAKQHEAVALTGCTQYLAAATYCYRDFTNRIYLMNRLGRLLGMDNDQANAKSPSGANPVHRMEICVSIKRIFIVTQNLFGFVSLYLANPTLKATLSYIRTVKFESSGVNWTLVLLPARKDHLISAIHSGKDYMLKIKLD